MTPFSLAIHGGAPSEHMVMLALAVVTAHESSDVWASCRTLRRLTMWQGQTVDVASYLSGKHFAEYVHGIELDLAYLQGEADTFLAAKGL